MSNPIITFVGAGNMAASLIGGLRAQGVEASAIRASEPGTEQRERLQQAHGIATFGNNAEAIAGADLIVLAVKPQVMKAVCLDLAPHLAPNQVIISIAAGISCASLEGWLGERPLVRCMPNTPALLRQGVSGLFANP
ncbi:MAG: pyrroline-5-carboxylate reductase, partial [Pseudomonadales bacterium]